MGIAELVLVAVLVLVVVSTALAVRVVPAGHAGLVERLGRPHRTVGPGLTVMVPYAERLAHRVDLREQEVALLGEPLVDRDSLLHHLDVRVHHAVTDARAATYAVADHRRALAELTRATLRRLVGELGTDEVAGHEAWVGRRVHEVLGRRPTPGVSTYAGSRRPRHSRRTDSLGPWTGSSPGRRGSAPRRSSRPRRRSGATSSS